MWKKCDTQDNDLPSDIRVKLLKNFQIEPKWLAMPSPCPYSCDFSIVFKSYSWIYAQTSFLVDPKGGSSCSLSQSVPSQWVSMFRFSSGWMNVMLKYHQKVSMSHTYLLWTLYKTDVCQQSRRLVPFLLSKGEFGIIWLLDTGKGAYY